MNAHVIGNGNIVSGMGCSVEGNNNTVSGMNAYVKGNNNIVSGMGATVDGDNNTVTGMNARARGKNNTVTGMGATNNGEKVKTSGSVIRMGNMTFNNMEGSVVQGLNFSGGSITCVGDNGATVIMNGDDMVIEKKKKNKKKSRKSFEFVEGPSPTDIKDDTPTDNDQESCIVCMTNKRNCIVLPCKHLTLCVTCAVTLCSGTKKDELKKIGEVLCPSCRESCTSIGKVFQ